LVHHINCIMLSLLLLSLVAQAVFSSEILDAIDLEERSCRDQVSDCWKHYSYCQNSGWLSYMQKNCKKTCGYCGGGGGSTGGGSTGGGSTGGGSSGGGNSGNQGGSSIPQGKCGQPSVSMYSDSSSYIVGGKEARPHSIPWQVSVQTRSGFHFCGATIINNKYALTAAHCVKPGDNIYIVAGAHSKRNWKNDGGKKYKVERIIKHRDYNRGGSLKNDIALLKIYQGIDLTTYAMPACLPPKGHEYQNGTPFLVSGWGTLSSGGSSPDKLMQVTVPLVPFEKCANQNRMDKNWRKVICAGLDRGGKDSCQGDSGGPLVTKLGGKWTLAGVVSWGKGCAKAGYPGVYTHVSHYIDWLSQNMN